MNIAIIGYGRMGHAVEEVALRRGHKIVARIDADNQGDFDTAAFAGADVAIEFTNASEFKSNLMKAWEKNVPLVSGTTGCNAEAAAREVAKELPGGGHTLLHSSNFSVGVNLLFALNRYLARIIAPYGEYRPSIRETHHVHKLDHPSGTAITLADDIIESEAPYHTWLEPSTIVSDDAVPITCTREGENPGFHEVKWSSPVDELTISHQARSREGFALGAVLGAEWLVRQAKGKVYSINDMFQF